MMSCTTSVDAESMRQLWSKYAIWVMDAGHIIISHQRFRPDSIDLQKLSSGPTTIPQQMFGHLLVPYLRWLLETFCSNQEKDKIMTRMMTI